MNPTRPSAGANTMHAPATLLRNRCGSAEPNMSNLLVVDPYVQGKTLDRADRYSYALPDLAMQRDVRAAVGPHVHQPRPAAQVLDAARLGVGQPERRGDRPQVEAGRRGDVLLEGVA